MDIDLKSAQDENQDLPKEETNTESVSSRETVVTRETKPRGSGKGKKVLLTLLVLLLIAGAAAGAWWFRDQEASGERNRQQQEISQLQERIAQLESELEALKNEGDDQDADEQQKRENIIAAVSTRNYAALEEYMADQVTVTMAGTDSLGQRPAEQAVNDIAFLSPATAPWTFDIEESTLERFSSTQYGEYFPEGAFVGMSSDDYVVSFTFDEAGNISAVFMAENGDEL